MQPVEALPVVEETPSPADELAELIPPSVAVALVDAIFERLEGNFLRDNIALIAVVAVAALGFYFIYKSTPPSAMKTQLEELGVGGAATSLLRLRSAAKATPTDIDDKLVDTLIGMMSERIKAEIARLLDERQGLVG